MAITHRVTRLRQQSLDAVPTLSSERAELMTEFYRTHTGLMSTPVQRALSFQYLLEHKTICIHPGELIVGEKGPAPKATPTYPELCCHTLPDLDILNSREKIPFAVSPATRQVYADTIIPFWQGRTMRELIFQEMASEWKDAYEAGIFTEFMEQRSPGHTVLDDKIYHKGMLDFKADIQASLRSLDFLNDPDAYAKQEQLKAMAITADALVCFAERHAEKALELAAQEYDPVRKHELERIAEVCTHVPAHAPRNFWEALQYYWFVHLGVTLELNPWDSFNPGKLDQHLVPFYRKGLDEGTLTREQAEELLQCFWIKFNNQPAPPKVGVTAAESGTYTDFAQINVGGVRPDGADGVNEVTYLTLDVIEDMRLLQPSSSIQVSKKNPDAFIQRAARIIRTGFGQPSVFNTETVIGEMLRAGKSLVDARCGGTSGCVETGAFGKENYNLTGYFNMPKVLEITLHNGADPRTGKQLGPQTGDPRAFKNFEALFAAYETQLRYFVDVKIRGNHVIERLYARYMPAPFLSLLISDCIANGKDYHDGGARYNTSYIQGVGLGSITDALTALKYHVYDSGGRGLETGPSKMNVNVLDCDPAQAAWESYGRSLTEPAQTQVTMDELLNALAHDFVGYERLRQLLLNRTPRYGNDDDYADSVTADGRKAWTPLSEGISPVQGADRHGPTAVIKSVAKMDHVRTGGTLLNQKFTPSVLQDDAGLDGLVHLIRAYFQLDGHHIQFNVVDAATLRAAQAHPEQYRDLIVRVAGYSDYFCDLGKALQDEIIARTAHEELR
jgi:pyruvate-formate lyase